RGHEGSRSERDRRERRITELRRRMKQHPCHACNDREAHARWAERWFRLKRDTDRLSSQVRGRTGAVAQVFDRITELLLELGYLERDEHGRLGVAPSGRQLRRIYGERDLLVAECRRMGLWNGVDAATPASLASALVYEPRREDAGIVREYPRGRFREVFEA